MDLKPGIEHQLTRTVTEEMTPAHLLPTVVLSTPKMIELMEQACLEAAQPRLADNETTVGVHVDVSHEAAAYGGEEVTCSCRLVEVDRRLLTFEVSVTAGDRIIGQGRHQRFVVDRARFGR